MQLGELADESDATRRHDLGNRLERRHHGRVVGRHPVLHDMRVHDPEPGRMPPVYGYVVDAVRRLVEKLAAGRHLRSAVEGAPALVRDDGKELAEHLQHLGFRPGVPVSGEEHRLVVLGEGVAYDGHRRLALLLAADGEVGCGDHAVLELAYEQDSRLLAGQRVLHDADRLLAGENHDPVLAAAERYRLGEGRVHSRKPGQLGGLVDARDALGLHIDLLQAGEVRTFGGDASRGAGDVELLVHPLAVQDVEGHDLHHRARGRFARARGGKRGNGANRREKYS